MSELSGSMILLLLVRRWTWVAGGAVLAATVAALVVISQPRMYTTSIDVVPKRARTEVNYDTRIRTVSSETTTGGQGQGAGGLTAVSAERRQALAQLVRNPDVEKVVREELGAALPPELRAPGALLDLVEARVVPRSEIITITVDGPSAAVAEQVALSWARAYERHVNQLYAPSGATNGMDAQVAEAGKQYDAAEASLTAFTATVPLAENNRLLARKLQQLNDILNGQQVALGDLYAVARRVNLFLIQAQALQQQLEAAQDNSATASNQLALTLLKTQAYAASIAPGATTGGASETAAPASPDQVRGEGQTRPEGQGSGSPPRRMPDWALPAGLQLQVPATDTPVTLAQQRADVAATVAALQEWRLRLQQDIQARSLGAFPAGSAPAPDGSESEAEQLIQRFEQEVRELQGTVAEQTARQKTLQQARDVALESYSSLLKKAEENRVANAVGAGNEVSLASQSVAGATLESRGLLRLTALAAVTGALLAATVLVLSSLWGAIYRQAEAAARQTSTSQPATSSPAAPSRNTAGAAETVVAG